jgi:hypothetical protein
MKETEGWKSCHTVSLRRICLRYVNAFKWMTKLILFKWSTENFQIWNSVTEMVKNSSRYNFFIVQEFTNLLNGFVWFFLELTQILFLFAPYCPQIYCIQLCWPFIEPISTVLLDSYWPHIYCIQLCWLLINPISIIINYVGSLLTPYLQ